MMGTFVTVVAVQLDSWKRAWVLLLVPGIFLFVFFASD